MLMLMMTNNNDLASKFILTIRTLFVFARITVLIIHIRPNSKDPLFDTSLVRSACDWCWNLKIFRCLPT